jgi:hypothetical protein
MIGLPQNLKQHNAKCTHIWPIAFRMPDARKAINSILYERRNDGLQSGKRLFRLTQKAPTTQKSAPAHLGHAPKAPTKPSLLTKSP